MATSKSTSIQPIWAQLNQIFSLPNDIPELEMRLQLRINLFSFDDPLGYMRFAMYISKKSFKLEINLLYWDGRYAWIKHISRLFCDTTK